MKIFFKVVVIMAKRLFQRVADEARTPCGVGQANARKFAAIKEEAYSGV